MDHPVYSGDAMGNTARTSRSLEMTGYLSLFDVFPELETNADTFSHNHSKWEQEHAVPAILAGGYKMVRGFYTMDGDSFGPLVRGCIVQGANGNQFFMTYG